jgi:hypothetical protein
MYRYVCCRYTAFLEYLNKSKSTCKGAVLSDVRDVMLQVGRIAPCCILGARGLLRRCRTCWHAGR